MSIELEMNAITTATGRLTMTERLPMQPPEMEGPGLHVRIGRHGLCDVSRHHGGEPESCGFGPRQFMGMSDILSESFWIMWCTFPKPTPDELRCPN